MDAAQVAASPAAEVILAGKLEPGERVTIIALDGQRIKAGSWTSAGVGVRVTF